VRKEVEFHNLSDAKLEVPFEAIEEGLKLGRLQFRWKQVCLWMRPEPPPSMTSANLATQMDYRLDLPLNFVAPLYLQHRSAPTAKKGVSIADIPDVFSTGGQPAAASDAPQPTPAISAPRTPAPAAKPARASGPKAERKPGEELAELFGEPGKRNWTPNDIVHKTTTLPGVAGALIALQDGLLVASCMPPTWKTETIAAFLPQIFGRMKQYTSELKMGDLHSVTFSVESGTLQVFNAGIIYFAALSHLGPDRRGVGRQGVRMRILIIGGTRFAGRALTEMALSRHTGQIRWRSAISVGSFKKKYTRTASSRNDSF
jgi:predicted regulator of Ras-like GTPase activity (Roadblock/LC7/MglB family)